MKNPFAHFVIIIVVIFTSSNVKAQATFHQDYIHGWTASSSSMDNIAHWCDFKFAPSWRSGPDNETWGNCTALGTSAGILYQDLANDHPNGEYVLVGYSAGGLMARKITQMSSTENDGDYDNTFVSGFVTIDAPNNGARIASHWQEWLTNSMLAQVKIGRGESSFLANVGYIGVLIFAPIAAVIGSLFQNYACQMTYDLKQSSVAMESLNSGEGLAAERCTQLGWVAIFGQIEASDNENRWRFPAYHASGNNTAINAAMDAYQSKINDARNKSHWHDQTANSKKKWYQIFSKIWHRMRAGDWNACANGYRDLNDAWEWSTAERAPSDGFISVQSQTHNSQLIPVEIEDNMNHDGAITVHGFPLPWNLQNGQRNGTAGGRAIYDALRFRLGLQPRTP